VWNVCATAMSEYKYACPVCGQHMICDTSQAGTVMECPTCFQKITAPQAPAAGEDQKFVLTGTKVGERPLPKVPAASIVAVPVVKSFPWIILILVLVAGLAGAGVYAFRGKLFHQDTTKTDGQATDTDVASAPKAPPIVLPSASDTNWTLSLDTMTTPEASAVGRVHGQSSTLDRVVLQGGVLTFRPSVHGSPDVSVAVNFSGALPEALAGQTINVLTNADQAARVTLHWKENGQNARDYFENGYALRLELGALTNHHIPGKVYFCAPDDSKSYLMGTFNAEIRKPKPRK